MNASWLMIAGVVPKPNICVRVLQILYADVLCGRVQKPEVFFCRYPPKDECVLNAYIDESHIESLCH